MLGVASVALWAAGCNRQTPSAEPISRWELDETSSANGVFEDRGPAFVGMIVAGIWPDMTTGSLVEGIGGTSAYTDGSAYATLPADKPAHDLAALTISFYYQRNSATAKHILLAAGNGSEVGDFSIEVLANGRLRGWHTGQDGELRFFEGTNGISGTNLQVGTAHRIDLSLGSEGARIYLDGAELSGAAITTNLNGWNNARVKYLGRWTDGVQAPAVGAFDRLRIWNRQLTAAEIADLEQAKSIILPGQPGDPGEPEPGEGLPASIAEIESRAGASVTERVAADGSGTHTSLQAALSAAVAGDVIAVKGTANNYKYYENWGISGKTATSTNPIQVWGWSPDGTQPEITAERQGSFTWTVHDADRQIWRTSVSGASFAYGFLPENEGGWQLIMHQSQSNFQRSASDNLYLGPSMWASSGVVYIRTQHGRRQTDRLVPDGILASPLPVEQNPNNWSDFRFSTVTSYAYAFTNCAHIHFNWLNWFGGFHGINVSGSQGMQFKRGKCWHHRFGIRFGGNCAGSKIDHFDSQMRCPLWLTRDDVKGGNRILDQFKDQAIYFDGTTGGVEVANSIAWYPFDWTLAGSGASDLHYHHNLVIGARDDAAQMGSGVVNWEMNHNVILGFAGPGHNSGSGQPSGSEAQVYLHHNIIDCAHASLGNGLGLINRNTEGFSYGNERCRASHDTPNGPIQYRFWNNTVVCGGIPESQPGSNVGYLYGDSANRIADGADRAHEFWNGIIIATTNHPVLGVPGGFGDVVTRHPSVPNNTPVEMMDGCMFAKASGAAPLLARLTRLVGGTVKTDYASLADYKAQSSANHYSASEDSGKYPEPPHRWNGNSFEEDPLLGGRANTNLTRFTLDDQGRFQIPANWSMYVPVNAKCEDFGVSIAGRWNSISPPDGPRDRTGIESGRTRFYIGAIDPVEDPNGTSVGPQP